MAWSGWSLDGSCQLDKGDHITWGDFHGHGLEVEALLIDTEMKAMEMYEFRVAMW